MATCVVSVKVRVTGGSGTDINQEYGSQEFTCGDQAHSLVYNVTTSAAALPLGGISNIGLLLIKNMSSTATVYVRNGAVGSNFIEIGPGEVKLDTPESAVVPYVIGSASAQIEYLIVEGA